MVLSTCTAHIMVMLMGAPSRALRQASRAVERYVLLCNRWGARSVALGQRVQALALLKAAESMTEPGAAPLEPPRRMALRAATFAEMCGYFRACEKLHAAMQYAKKAGRARCGGRGVRALRCRRGGSAREGERARMTCARSHHCMRARCRQHRCSMFVPHMEVVLASPRSMSIRQDRAEELA